MYFSCETVLFQHADLWVEAQFSFPIFSLSCKGFCRRQWFCGRTFLVLLSCCFFGLLFSWCWPANQFLAVRLSGLIVTNMSHVLPAELKHERPPCFKAFLPHRDKSCPQRGCKHNQRFRPGFPVTPPPFLAPTALSLSSQDHHIYHKQMLTSRFVCNATLNIVILIGRWVIQSYLAEKIQYYQNTSTRVE